MRPRPDAEELALRVLYEDESVLAIDKPPGMVVHPTYRNWSGTVLNAALWHVRDRPGVRPAVLTRLDKDTSGVVLLAISPEVQAAVQRDAAAGLLRKQYLAVVRGRPEPPTGTIALPLARSAADRRLVVVSVEGALSETRYEVAASDEEMSVLRCELVTGRTHQIRVHLAARGWPLLGDATYCVADPRIGRQALHAWNIRLPHPVTREPLAIEASLPEDMRRLDLLQKLTL